LQRENFRVCGRIATLYRRIAGRGYPNPLARNQHCADRNLAGLSGRARACKRFSHEIVVLRVERAHCHWVCHFACH
jgi:hypothetical protein